jgi:hypothetical protein
LTSRCGKQIDDLLDGLVGFMISSLQFALGLVVVVGLMVEASVGKGPAETLVEEQEQERDVHALGGEPIGVSAAVPLEKSMAFQLAQIVAELVEAVGLGRERKGFENGWVNLLGGPTAQGGARVHENLQQTEEAGILDAEAGIADSADGDGQSEALQKGKVHLPIQTLSLKASKAVRDDLKLLAHGVQMIESFPQAEVIQVVR